MYELSKSTLQLHTQGTKNLQFVCFQKENNFIIVIVYKQYGTALKTYFFNLTDRGPLMQGLWW